MQWPNIEMKPDRDAKQLCAVIRQERAEELARAGMGSNSARKCHTMAVLKGALTKQEIQW